MVLARLSLSRWDRRIGPERRYAATHVSFGRPAKSAPEKAAGRRHHPDLVRRADARAMQPAQVMRKTSPALPHIRSRPKPRSASVLPAGAFSAPPGTARIEPVGAGNGQGRAAPRGDIVDQHEGLNARKAAARQPASQAMSTCQTHASRIQRP
jgi:hypothetical protein